MTPAEFSALPSPQFWRRVSCTLYEQLVLLGVVALTFLVPNLALGILFGVSLPSWLTFLYLYVVLGLYLFGTGVNQVKHWRCKLGASA